MSEYKTKRLITWEQFEAEFKPVCEMWHECNSGQTDILYKYNGMSLLWLVSNRKISKFGSEIKVRKINYGNFDYTHQDEEGNWYHELWFEPEFKPIEFITEEEMEIN